MRSGDDDSAPEDMRGDEASGHERRASPLIPPGPQPEGTANHNHPINEQRR